jgi:hypothetical protein
MNYTIDIYQKRKIDVVEEGLGTSIESNATDNNIDFHQRIRDQLWDGLDSQVVECLVNYLANNNVEEENPILVVEYLPYLDTVITLYTYMIY